MESIQDELPKALALKRLKVSGALSFGPTGINLEFKRLNVLIGPNGSGKSNLLEILSLLKAAPRGLTAPINFAGDAKDWLWKGREPADSAVIEATIAGGPNGVDLLHRIQIGRQGFRAVVMDESVLDVGGEGGRHFEFDGDSFSVLERGKRRLISPSSFKREESVLSQLRDPADGYPAFSHLEKVYEGIRPYRNWNFGPSAPQRREQNVAGRSDLLVDGNDNLTLVLSHFQGGAKRKLIEVLKKLYGGIVGYDVVVQGGATQLFIEESDGRQIPASRLSDGTLRFLYLLAIFMSPIPASIVMIEEPELGLHPDLIPTLAELLRTASERMQILVTTHSRQLVDALGDEPEAVVVCEREDGESRFERLDGERMKHWLDRYSLGELWSIGELGGNRW